MPAPVHVVTTVGLHRPPDAVWPFLVDWERLDRWMEEIRDVRVTSEHREGVGVEAEATVRIGGLSTRDRIRVTRWEPPTVLEIAHLGWVRGAGYMELSPTEEGSRLFWRETLIPPWGILGSAGFRLFLPMMRRVFRRDVHRLRDVVRAGT
jgi:carbon monoxide dehydrogenase subunit G